MNAAFQIKALEIIEQAANNEKLMEKQRVNAVMAFFDKASVKQVLIQHIALTKEMCAADLQKEAILQIASHCIPGATVNLRELEESISVEGVSTNFLRNHLIPTIQRTGLIVPKPNGANGWLWAEISAPNLLDSLKHAASNALQLAQPENPELAEEQRKLAAEQRLSEVANRRLLLAKQNAKLIAEASKLNAENEAEILKNPIRPVAQQNQNLPALLAAGFAAVLIGALLINKNTDSPSLPTAQAAMAEPAPDYNSMTDEDILRLQMGDQFDRLPATRQQAMIAELQAQRTEMSGGKI